MQPQNKKIKDFNKLGRLFKAGTVFTAFDSETTTCTPTTGRIIELGAVKFNCNGEISRYECLFNPDQEISPFIQNLTHITNKMVIDAPKIESKLPEFLDFIKDSVLIAHNAQFDINFLTAEIEKAKFINPRNRFIDTLQLSRWAYPEFEHHNLLYLAQTLEINPGHSHRALDDAITCMELFKKIINYID